MTVHSVPTTVLNDLGAAALILTSLLDAAPTVGIVVGTLFYLIQIGESKTAGRFWRWLFRKEKDGGPGKSSND